MPETTTFKIFRFDPTSGKPPRFDTYQVQVRPGLSVLEALFEILEFQDPTLAFRYSCRGAVCGSCAMHINGKYRLACQTQVGTLGPEVVIQPLQHFPIIKDLVVDQEGVFGKYRSIQPFLQPQDDPPQKERIQSHAEREKIDEGSNCILCFCCQTACPMTLTDKEYLGPAILLKLDRFYQDSRDAAKDLRLDLANSEHGAWRCHTVFNCTAVCPKDLRPAEAIAHLKQGLIARKLFGWLKRRKG